MVAAFVGTAALAGAASLAGAGVGAGGEVGVASLVLSSAAFRFGRIEGMGLCSASLAGASLALMAAGFSALAISLLSNASLAAFNSPAASLAFLASSTGFSLGGRQTSRRTLSSSVPVRTGRSAPLVSSSRMISVSFFLKMRLIVLALRVLQS